MHILAIGASRNIGYLACLQLLAQGHTVTYLLRKVDAFDTDPKITQYIQEGRAKCIKGDATIRADVQRAFDAVTADGKLDVVLSSVGGIPSFSLQKGFVINPPNLCSSSILNILISMPDDTPTSPQPKLIALSSYGLTKAGYKSLPFLLKPLFSYGLRRPHLDKLIMERAISHAASWKWDQDELQETTNFLGNSWQNELRAPGYLKNVVILRPSLLVDGDDKPAKGIYRASTGEMSGAYTISRKEVAHFIVEGLLKNWEEWTGKVVNLSI